MWFTIASVSAGLLQPLLANHDVPETHDDLHASCDDLLGSRPAVDNIGNAPLELYGMSPAAAPGPTFVPLMDHRGYRPQATAGSVVFMSPQPPPVANAVSRAPSYRKPEPYGAGPPMMSAGFGGGGGYGGTPMIQPHIPSAAPTVNTGPFVAGDMTMAAWNERMRRAQDASAIVVGNGDEASVYGSGTGGKGRLSEFCTHPGCRRGFKGQEMQALWGPREEGDEEDSSPDRGWDDQDDFGWNEVKQIMWFMFLLLLGLMLIGFPMRYFNNPERLMAAEQRERNRRRKQLVGQRQQADMNYRPPPPRGYPPAPRRLARRHSSYEIV